MKKKLYIKPMIENIKMLEESSILAASGEANFDATINGRDTAVEEEI